MAVDANLGKASVAIRATLDQLDGDLSDARGRVDNAMGRMARGAGRAFQTVGKVALGGIGVATGAAAGLAGVLGKLTVDAAPVEGISDAFEGLAESAGYGQDEMLAALQRGSSGMIAQRDLMMSFNKAASLVSTDFATQLPDAMQYLSKVSAATGQDMGFLMDSLVTGVGRLSPMILDNLSIQVSQAEATERAAEMFGVEAAQLSKTQQQAGMMNVVLEKLAANTASMPDVTDSAAAKMAQFRATIQDTKDRIGMALLPVLSTLMTVFGDIAARVLPPLVGFIEGTLAPAVERITSVISDFLWMLSAGVSPIGALKIALSQLFGPEIAATILNIVAGVQQFITQARAALAPVMSWLSQNVKLQDVLVALGAAISSVVIPALVPIIGAVSSVVGIFLAAVAVVAALRTAWENLPAILERLRGVWISVKEAVAPFVNAILPSLQSAWLSISETMQANLAPILERLRSLWEGLKAALQAIGIVIGTVLVIAIGLLSGVISGLAEGIAAAFPHILGIVQGVISVLTGVFQTFAGIIQWITGLVTGNTEKQRAAWEMLKTGVVNIVTGLWEIVKNLFVGAFRLVVGVVSGLVNGIIRFFQNLHQRLVGGSIIPEMWEAIKATFSDAISSIVSLVSGLVKDIISFFTDTDWGAVGRNILEGIAKGITSGLEIIKNAAKRAAQAALDAAKVFLGIHSPARVPADEIGEPSGEGIARGFIASIPSIRQAARQASEQLVSAAQRSLAMPQMMATPQGAGMSAATFGQGLPPITINIDRVADDIDIEMMTRKVVRAIQRRGG